MPRPHLEFIQCQTIPWAILGKNNSRSGTEIKVLSSDQDTGASTAIIRYPEGWLLSAPHYLQCDEELYVLDGCIKINELAYEKGDYAYLPAGFQRNTMSSPSGSAVITFYEGNYQAVAGAAPEKYYSGNKLIRRMQTSKNDWHGAGDDTIASPDVGLKVLRLDPDTGERTWILKIDVPSSQPFKIDGVEKHPCVEETFLLEGDMSMTMGVMLTGAYFWRPPNIEHGPMGTRAGFLGLFRCKGGPLTTEWANAPTPIKWDAPFDPILPDNLREFSTRQYDPSLSY